MKGYGEETSRGRRRHVRLVGLISNPFLRYLAYHYIALKMLSQNHRLLNDLLIQF